MTQHLEDAARRRRAGRRQGAVPRGQGPQRRHAAREPARPASRASSTSASSTACGTGASSRTTAAAAACPLQECPTWHAILEARRRSSLAGAGIPPVATARIDLAQPRSCGGRGCSGCSGPGPAAAPAGRRSTGTPPRRRRCTARSPTSPARASSSTRRGCRSNRSRLGLVPGVDVRVAQVIRDPRAVVYSWKRSKRTTDRDDVEYMPKFSASYSTTSWLARNLVVEADPAPAAPVEVVQYDEIGA